MLHVGCPAHLFIHRRDIVDRNRNLIVDGIECSVSPKIMAANGKPYWMRGERQDRSHRVVMESYLLLKRILK